MAGYKQCPVADHHIRRVGNRKRDCKIQRSLNTTGSPRTGTLTIAGQTFTVNQSNLGCSYSIAPTSNSFPASGGNGSVTVTTLTGCVWKAISNDSWIIVSVDGNSQWQRNGKLCCRSKYRCQLSHRHDNHCGADFHCHAGRLILRVFNCAIRKALCPYRRRGQHRSDNDCRMQLDCVYNRAVDNSHFRAVGHRKWRCYLCSERQSRNIASARGDYSRGACVHSNAGRKHSGRLHILAQSDFGGFHTGWRKRQHFNQHRIGMRLGGDNQRKLDNVHIKHHRYRHINGDLYRCGQRRSGSQRHHNDRETNFQSEAERELSESQLSGFESQFTAETRRTQRWRREK